MSTPALGSFAKTLPIKAYGPSHFNTTLCDLVHVNILKTQVTQHGKAGDTY